MNLVLAIEPDASQADPLTSLVRALGAELQLVDSTRAAIVAMDQGVPDAVLLGRNLSQEQRTEIVKHLRLVTAEGTPVRTIDIPQLTNASLTEAFTRKIGVSLAAADYVRVQALASVVEQPVDPGWSSISMDASSASDEVRLADVGLIEAEVEFRLKAELERLQADSAQQQARELARVEAEAAERRAREIARVEAEAAQQRAQELAKIEQLAASQRETAIAEAKAAAEKAAREGLEAELERVRREAEEQLAAEVRRVRQEAEQMLASKADLAQSQAERDREERITRLHAEAEAAKAARAEADSARADAEAAKRVAIEEARRVVEEAAARAKIAEDEVERVKSEANDQLKAAVAKARAESEARLQAEVARAQAETETRLEAQLASVIGQAEQARHEHREISVDVEKMRREATQAARAAADAALAAETARIRAEANERLEQEIERLRVEAARAEAERADGIPLFASSAQQPGFFDVSKAALLGVRWDFVATAAICSLVVVAGVLYLPRAVSTAAHTSSRLAGTAGRAAKQVVAAAPGVTRRAVNAAERVIPRPAAVDAAAEPLPTEAEVDAAVAAIQAPADKSAGLVKGPGFVTVYSRLPMQVYADGKRIGTSDDGQILLKSGAHRLEFVNEHFHYRSAPTTLTILPGHVHPYNVVLPTAEVRVTTTPGAEVWVEGERVGIAPLEPLQVPIGTREIVVKDATGEKHQAIEVKYGDTLELSLVPQGAADDAAPATPHLAPLVRSR